MRAVSIGIVAWNCKKVAEECVESLRAYSQDPNAEIIVVDNASSDGTCELVRDSYPGVTLIQSEANLGFAKANNIGIRKSSGKYICLVNPDVRVLDGCIEKMLAYIEENPRICLLGPRMLGADGKSSSSSILPPTQWRISCLALSMEVFFPRSKLFGDFLMLYFSRDHT